MAASPGSADGSPADRVRDLLEQIAASCAIEAEVSVTEDDEALRGTLEGDDLGLLIGRHGQTIDAIEHLAVRAAFRGDEERKRVIVDAAGYRERRAEALQRQADRAAAEAARFGRPVALDAMAAAERRIVHEYLRDRRDVETYSEGEEPDRHLVIAPVVA
jgi:spoIIIJ-associated protein